jgi:hypothetical protein
MAAGTQRGRPQRQQFVLELAAPYPFLLSQPGVVQQALLD